MWRLCDFFYITVGACTVAFVRKDGASELGLHERDFSNEILVFPALSTRWSLFSAIFC